MPFEILATWPVLVAATTYDLRLTAHDEQIIVSVGGTVVADVTVTPIIEERRWTRALLSQEHGDAGGSPPADLPVRADTWFDDLDIADPGGSFTPSEHVYDSFDRTDAGDGTLGASDSGHRWVTMAFPTLPRVFGATAHLNGGTWTTRGYTPNTAQAIAPNHDSNRVMIAAVNTRGANQDLTVIGSFAANDHLRVGVRCSSDWNYGYHALFTNVTTCFLARSAPDQRGNRLRQFPRDDALAGVQRPRREATSIQASTRQGWAGTYR